MKFNKDDKRRHEILGLNVIEKYDCQHFDYLTLKQLETLVKENFIDLEEAQNNAPTVDEILKFMKENKRFTCHGYIITPARDDYRVSLEGVQLTKSPTIKERVAFTDLFRRAEEFRCNSKDCRCWYD